MAKTFKQVFFKPGRYHLGGGIYRDFTAGDVAEHVRGAQAVIDAGHGIPILYEHAAPGSAEGSPVQLSAANPKSRRDKLADQVKHGAGWVKRVWVTKDGAAAHELEVTDPEAAKGLKNGSIKFTSPEFRANWTDGKGREFKRLVSHVALTHKPRNLDQSAIEEVVTGAAPALQFSLADWAQFSENDMDDEQEKSDEKPEGTPPEDKPEEKNPDLEDSVDEQESANDQQFHAVLQLLKDSFGVSLPDDCDKDSFVRDLLTSLKTAAAIKEQNDADDANDDEDDKNPDDDNDLVEEKPPVQFSLADVTEGKVASKLLSAVIRSNHAFLANRIKARQDEGTFPPALVRAIEGRAGAMQFSEEGDEFGIIKLTEVVDLLEKGLPKGFYKHLSEDLGQQLQFSTENPPDELLTQGANGDVTQAQAKKLVDAQQAAGVPLLNAKR